MTIKELLTSYHSSMETFVNPENKPLEKLKIKYSSDDRSYEELIPALDQKWCKKDYVFTLYMPPPFKNNDGEFTMGSKEDWLERINLFVDDMNLLLQLEYHRFWSEVMYNSHSLDGLSSFLQNAPPFYLRDQFPQDKGILKMYKKAQELVFLVLMRLTQSKESEEAWMKNETLGNILYNNFVISLPQLMELCLIYGSDNFREVSELINRVIEIQPKYMHDIEKSIPFICEVFSKFENQLGAAVEENGSPLSIANSKRHKPSVEIVKLIFLLLDIGYSLATFLQVCPQAGTKYHEHQLEHRIANFYGNTVPILNRHLDSQYNNETIHEQYTNYQLKLNLSRHQLILVVHGCLTTCLSTILEKRDSVTEQEMKSRVDNYLNTLSDCLSDHVFIRDYNTAFPIQRELKVLSDICPGIDTLKCDFIVESVMSLYDLLPKTQKNVIHPSVQANSSKNAFKNHTPKQHSEICTNKKATGVELESLITEVKDILPHLGNGFITICLEHFNYVSPDVINAILEGNLPDSLASLDPDMPAMPSESTEVSNGLPERINVFDNDEFDIMTNNKVDTTRVHKGKWQEKHKNLFQMLDDKSHVNELRDVYTQLSLVECMENVNEYEDEYDDTYDDLDVPVGNEGETEAVERRAFVIPRVLQQQKKSLEEEFPNYGEEEEEEEQGNEGAKADLFIENPADIRARAEQRRQELRGRGSGRSRAAFPRRDVVGKPKGQGQEKEVIKSREFKNTNKVHQGNHNRRSMAAKKRRQGMVPT